MRRLVFSAVALTVFCTAVPSSQAETPFTFEFQVLDYIDKTPIPGIEIRVSEDTVCTRNGGCRPVRQHPEHLRVITQRTDKNGRTIFALPDKGYGHYVPEHTNPKYIMFSAHYRLGAQQRQPLRTKSVSRAGESYTLYLVPYSMLKIRTEEAAVEAADANPELAKWLASQDRKTLKRYVKGGGTVWQVGYGRNNRLKRNVLVNSFDGSTSVNGRWN